MENRTKLLLIPLSVVSLVVGNQLIGDYLSTKRKLDSIVKQTGMKMDTAEQYLKLDSDPKFVDEFHEIGLTPNLISKIKQKGKFDSDDQEKIAENETLKGKDYEAWLDENFSLDEIFIYNRYGITKLEDAVQIRDVVNREDNVRQRGDMLWVPKYFSDLYSHDIPAIESIPLLKKGISIKQIIKKYADEAGVSVDLRRRYIWEGAKKNPEIKLLNSKGVTPDILDDLTLHSYKGYSIDKVVKMAEENKLSGAIYNRWESEGFSPHYIFICLYRGYEMEESKIWKDSGFSATNMDKARQMGAVLKAPLEFK